MSKVADLQRHPAAEPGILGQVNRPHPPRPSRLTIAYRSRGGRGNDRRIAPSGRGEDPPRKGGKSASNDPGTPPMYRRRGILISSHPANLHCRQIELGGEFLDKLHSGCDLELTTPVEIHPLRPAFNRPHAALVVGDTPVSQSSGKSSRPPRPASCSAASSPAGGSPNASGSTTATPGARPAICLGYGQEQLPDFRSFAAWRGSSTC